MISGASQYQSVALLLQKESLPEEKIGMAMMQHESIGCTEFWINEHLPAWLFLNNYLFYD